MTGTSELEAADFSNQHSTWLSVHRSGLSLKLPACPLVLCCFLLSNNATHVPLGNIGVWSFCHTVHCMLQSKVSVLCPLSPLSELGVKYTFLSNVVFVDWQGRYCTQFKNEKVYLNWEGFWATQFCLFVLVFHFLHCFVTSTAQTRPFLWIWNSLVFALYYPG